MSAPTSPRPSRFPRGILLYSTLVSLLALAAAVVSFVKGSWLLGVVWLVLATLASNMAWFQARRARAEREDAGS
ncbi:MAG TPA: hypothetical protein VFH77_17120 [Streptomyces sp.]|jgi:hypothetical protein|nr:hypothetical protein [Streptomyces sp.]